MKQMYVYILRCKDDTFYIGVTNDLETRVIQHNQGSNEWNYTSKASRRPVTLVYYETFMSATQAIDREKQLKGWSRRKKMALIEGDDHLLRELSQSQNKGN
jgi:putative endonuclease